MRHLTGVILLGVLLMAGAGCDTINEVRGALDPSVARSQAAAAAETQMIGMSQEQILACMGPPDTDASAGTTDAWRYRASDGRIDGSIQPPTLPGSALGTMVSARQRYCDVSVTFADGRVSRIAYQGYTGSVLARNEQCGYAVAGCVQ